MRRALAAGTFTVVALAASASWGQPTAPPADARAEALFNAAKQLRDSGQAADACPMFLESKKLAPGVGVTLYLADCYERTGKTASAWQQFKEAEQLARDHGDEKRAVVARDRAQALEAKLGRLTVASSGTHDGWQVLVDGGPLPAERWNSALAVDPGDHTVTVDAPGQPQKVLHAQIDASHLMVSVRIDEAEGGGAVAAALPVAPSGAAASSPEAVGTTSAPLESTAAPASGGTSARLWTGLGLVAVGVAGVGLGTAFLIKRNQNMNSGTLCDPPTTDMPDATGAGISFGVGGAALVTALVLYLTAPHASTTGLVVTPTPLWGGGGAVVRSAF